jgi:sporulation protein YlmC with PRC-barrel domain
LSPNLQPDDPLRVVSKVIAISPAAIRRAIADAAVHATATLREFFRSFRRGIEEAARPEKRSGYLRQFQSHRNFRELLPLPRGTQLRKEHAVSKISTAAAFAAITAAMAAAMPAAYAQTHRAADAPARMSERSAALQIQQDQVRASQMIGSTIYDVENRNIGSVKDLVLDRDGKVAEVVIDVGSFLGMGGKYVAVKMSDINADNNRLTLDKTKQQLQQMAEYRLTDRNTGAGMTPSPATGGQLGR